MEYYSAVKNEIMPFAATWMELEIIMLSEVSQKEKDKYQMLSFILQLCWIGFVKVLQAACVCSQLAYVCAQHKSTATSYAKTPFS